MSHFSHIPTAATTLGDHPPDFVLKVLNSPAPIKLLTLVLVHQGDQVLLGRKKRGFGEGYFNGFGGKVEAGETVEQAASRELEEEAGICAADLHHQGLLTFVFDDQERPWEVHVFAATAFRGEPCETEEMAPVWVNKADIPYQSMWADDVFWYPLFMRGQRFQGVFGFKDTHRLVWHRLREAQGPFAPALDLVVRP